MSSVGPDDLSKRTVAYELVFECQNCGNVNACETKVDWTDPPVDCGECGERDWERIDEEGLD